MILHNDTSETVKVCIYKTSDHLMSFPCSGGLIWISKKSAVDWAPEPEESCQEFNVRFFRPDSFDALLAGIDRVPRNGHPHLVETREGYEIM